MCGRYTLKAGGQELSDLFGLFEEPEMIEPRYNIAPTQQIPVVQEEDAGRKLELMHWGLIPLPGRRDGGVSGE